MTFPLDYHSKNDLRPFIMFNVETENRNPHIKKDIICDIKDNIWNAKTSNVFIKY